MRPEWKGRAAFAEVAEAIGIPTDEIMATYARKGGMTVVYSVGVELDSRVRIAWLTREADGRLTIEQTEDTGWTVRECLPPFPQE